MDISLIENQVNTNDLDKYAAIIGENPSNGARSPRLWNAAFKKYKLNCSMLPLDVTHENIINLLNDLNQDNAFIGGAIAVPYKEVVAKWLGKKTTIQARNIGAVNCLYRNDLGELQGTNTDGEAALRSYEFKYGSVKGKAIVILGTGGAAKAVAAYFANAVGINGKVILVGRSGHGKAFAANLKANWIEWNELNDNLKNIDLVINCSSIGFGEQKELSPMTYKQIQMLKKSAVVFDIIYQPLDTRLIKMARDSGISTIGGLMMNLEQAVLAFNYANYQANDELITREAMHESL